MANNTATRAGNISRFQIYQAKNNAQSVDMSAGAVELKYYENILSNSVSATVVIVETGLSGKNLGDQLSPTGIIDTLPIRGGEQTILEFEDNQPIPNKLSFKAEKSFYVNRVRDIDPGTQKDVYSIDLSTREFIANEQTRVVKRYDGKISDSIRSILTDKKGLNTQKNIELDTTLINYNFIGNDRKPFYVGTWLASKSVPELSINGKSSKGGTAGYLFYENYEGFKFKSIDKLFEQKPVKKYIFNKNANKPNEYDDKILSYKIERDIDLQQNITLGTYSNRSIFFDFYSMGYRVRNFNVDDYQKDKMVNAGKQDILYVAEEFRKPTSRLMSHVLDVGALPSGKGIDDQLSTWKNTPFDPTYDATNTMVQSIMRYNQMFTIKINIMIPGDFSLKAGQLIHCDFPELTIEGNKKSNQSSGGIYMISSLCHRVTTRNTFTSLTLVRDTFGRKPF
jgi:hypothetical protein